MNAAETQYEIDFRNVLVGIATGLSRDELVEEGVSREVVAEHGGEALREARKQGIDREDIDASWFGAVA